MNMTFWPTTEERGEKKRREGGAGRGDLGEWRSQPTQNWAWEEIRYPALQNLDWTQNALRVGHVFLKCTLVNICQCPSWSRINSFSLPYTPPSAILYSQSQETRNLMTRSW